MSAKPVLEVLSRGYKRLGTVSLAEQQYDPYAGLDVRNLRSRNQTPKPLASEITIRLKGRSSWAYVRALQEERAVRRYRLRIGKMAWRFPAFVKMCATKSTEKAMRDMVVTLYLTGEVRAAN